MTLNYDRFKVRKSTSAQNLSGFGLARMSRISDARGIAIGKLTRQGIAVCLL